LTLYFLLIQFLAMIALNNPVESLRDYKVKLTVPLVSKLLLEGKRQADIATVTNNTAQNVSIFIKRNYDAITTIIDPDDRLLAFKSKEIASKATDLISNILTVDKFTRKDLVSLNITAGTQIDKYRLLSNKSTSNVSIARIDADLDDLDKQEQELTARLKEIS